MPYVCSNHVKPHQGCTSNTGWGKPLGKTSGENQACIQVSQPTSLRASSSPRGHSCMRFSISGMFLQHQVTQHSSMSNPTLTWHSGHLWPASVCASHCMELFTIESIALFADLYVPDAINPIIHLFALVLWISDAVYCLWEG